jgi:hypothetical protein
MFSLSLTGFGYTITDLLGFNSIVAVDCLLLELVISSSVFAAVPELTFSK